MLLYLEELQMTVDMKKFNMVATPMIRDEHDKKLITLAVCIHAYYVLRVQFSLKPYTCTWWKYNRI